MRETAPQEHSGRITNKIINSLRYIMEGDKLYVMNAQDVPEGIGINDLMVDDALRIRNENNLAIGKIISSVPARERDIAMLRRYAITGFLSEAHQTQHRIVRTVDHELKVSGSARDLVVALVTAIHNTLEKPLDGIEQPRVKIVPLGQQFCSRLAEALPRKAETYHTRHIIRAVLKHPKLLRLDSWRSPATPIKSETP